MEDELLGVKNPLYGRATGIYKMEPLPFVDAIKFFPNYSEEGKIIAYSILGGIPHYLNQFDPNKTLKDNIIENILTKGTVLYSEVEFLLRQELREISVYNTVIEAIALGNTTFNDIFLKTQIDKTKISVYLRNLAELDIIRREFLALSGVKENSGSAKGQYYLTDNFFRFWFAYGYSNLSYLERGDAEGVWEDYISNDLHHFASKSFEEVCISYLYEMNKKKDIVFYNNVKKLSISDILSLIPHILITAVSSCIFLFEDFRISSEVFASISMQSRIFERDISPALFLYFARVSSEQIISFSQSLTVFATIMFLK